MSYQLFLAYTTEGSTDIRFLSKIFERTISDILFLYGNKDTEIVLKSYQKEGHSFVDQMINVFKNCFIENSSEILFIHADADDISPDNTLEFKFTPLRNKLDTDEQLKAFNFVEVIPVHMTEAWMLADFVLFKDEIKTDKSKSQLNLSGNPETFKDPKKKIVDALNIVNSELPKKRRNDLKIGDLYQIIGQKLDIEQLLKLESYKTFYTKTFEILKKINLINYNEVLNINL
ncbi:DUF4276 family protein [Chryseobacterium contaminans]|uniref:DUF4276 family protein n=1 Tax=Chryseobacterium contaminans TaxID=1423959 RepID=UPI00301AA3C4